MVTKIRLGWETRLDQLNLTVSAALAGVGLIVLGAFADGFGGVLLIILGSLISVVVMVRLNGWRSLLWPRNLTVGPDGIADDTKKGTAFHVRWPDLVAVGVITEPDAITLVFTFRKAVRRYRVPPRAGILPAIRQAATCPVSELPPPEGDRVIIDIGRSQGAQGIVGGFLAGFFGVIALVAAFDPSAPTAGRVIAGIIGTPLTLIALGTLLGLPALVRKRRIVVDGGAFTWDDPTEQSFTVAWDALAGISVDTTVVTNMKSGDRSSVHVVFTPPGPDFADHHRDMAKFQAGDGYVLPLGPQNDNGVRVADAISHFAPGVWRGLNAQRGRFGIT
jgi:hypothetical protein